MVAVIYPMEGYTNDVPMLEFPIRLDLGAGAYPRDGFVRMDKDRSEGGTHIIWDISRGIPLPNGSVSELWTSHFLEHLIEPHAHYVLQEMWRVCIDGALVTIKVPHEDTPEGHLPGHYSFWNERKMQAIHQWFPHEGHDHYNGNYWDLQRIWREEPCHLIATYKIVKGRAI